jgi:hypothetical protein
MPLWRRLLRILQAQSADRREAVAVNAATRGQQVVFTSAAVLTGHALVMNLLFFTSTSRVYGSASVQNLHRARTCQPLYPQHLNIC